MTDNVTQVHPEYALIAPDWITVRDTLAGARRIKSKTTQYLPVPQLSMLDDNKQPNSDYFAYLQRASYQNFTAATVDGMVGAVFRRNPQMNAEEWGNVQYLATNVDGQNTSLDLQAKTVTTNVSAVGRDGLLVDFPSDQVSASVADVESGVARATIQRRSAEQIINWRWDEFGADNRLVLVVIKERFNSSPTRFEHDSQFRYRVLRIDADNTYWQDIYLDDGGTSAVSSIQVQAQGRPLNFIPFVFIGTEQNNADINKPPVLDIANTNISHYQVDAEQKHSMHKHSTPQPVAEGVDAIFRKQFEDAPMTLGADTVLMLPPGAKFHIAQVDFQHTGYQDELARLENAMKKMGARLFDDDNRARESGQALGIRRQGQNSVMGSIAKNVSQGYRLAVEWAGLFMGSDIDPKIKLNTDFKVTTLDANTIAQLSLEVDKGHIAIEDYHQALREGELLQPNRSTKDILEDVANAPPPPLVPGDGSVDNVP